MINSRSLDDLIPPARARAARFIDHCKLIGIDVLITSTYRDIESQNALYAQGRTTKGVNPRPEKPLGDTVTSARGGQSFHNFKCAFDFVPIVNGKAQWNDKGLFRKCGEVAENVGLEWAGRWKARVEMAHCQYTGGLTLSDLQKGRTIV